jgi:hypothetical protein|tara:strand:+ start:76 stop:357 length:282 start_codon:yes stop_codon:yes gene_type:complete
MGKHRQIDHEEFKLIVEGRTQRAINNILMIERMAKPKRFEYTVEDILTVKAAVVEALDRMEATFVASKQKRVFKLNTIRSESEMEKEHEHILP